MNKKFTKLMAALALLTFLAVPMGMQGQTRAEGDEITSISNIVSGNTYYIKGVRSNNTYYLTFTDAVGSQSGTESSTTSGAIPVTFTLVSGNTYTLRTPNGNYIAPGTSNGKINVSATAINVTATDQNSKIRLSIVSSSTTWSIQKNTSAANFGGYKNTQADITLIEAGAPAPSMSVSPTSIDFGNENTINPNEPYTRTFNVTFANLTESLSVNVGSGLTGVSVSPTSIAANATSPQTVTVSYHPTAEGNLSGNITVSSSEVTTASVSVSGSAYDPANVRYYEKVTEASTNWSGEYIFTGINSSNYYALTGVSSDLGTTAQVTVTENAIQSTPATDGYKVTVAQTTNGYSLYLAGAGYLYYTGSKNLLYAAQTFTANSCEWTISFANGVATITNVGSSLRMLQFNYNNGNPRFACYTSSQVKLTLFKYNDPNKVKAPTFSPEGGIYTAAQNVTISSETSGASIYYTTDGSMPTTESTPFTEAFTVSTTTTVKAIAVKNGMTDSDVASTTYTFVTPFTTMQQVYEDAVANTFEHEVYITFNNWVITGTNGSSPSQFYLTDPDNAYGCVIYGSESGFTRGNTLNGTVRCKLLYFSSGSSYSFAEIKELTTQTDGLTVGTGGSVTPITTTIDALTSEKTGTVVKLENLTYNGTVLTDNNNNIINNSNYIYSAPLSTDKTYNITGVFTYASAQNNTPKRICPRSADDIEEVIITDPYITIESDEFELTANEEEGYLEIIYGNLPEEFSFDIQCYDAEGNEIEECVDWLGLAIEAPEGEEGDFVYYFTSANQGPVRTAYFKVYASWLVEVDGDVEIESAYSNLVTVTQAEFVPDYVVLPFNWEGGTSADLEAINGVTVECDPTDYAASNAPYRVKFNDDGYYILVKTNDQPAVVSVGIKKFAAGNTSSLVIQGSSDGDNFTDVQTFSITGAQNATFTYVTTNAFAATDRYVRIYFNKPSNGSNVGVGPITISGLESYTLTINAHTTNGGWYLIASPVAVNPANVEGMTIENSEDPNYSNFDLYYFDQTGGQNGKEWKNYKANHFDLELGKGYLYANANTVDLTFTGVMNGDFEDVDLPYDADDDIKSLYLAGNSKTMAETFYVYDGNSVKQTVNFLTLNDDRNGFITTLANSFTVEEMQGFFVQSGGENWTLSTADMDAKSGTPELLNVMVSQNRGTLVDNAIVSFGNAPLMSKFYLSDNSTRVFIQQNGEEMAVVRTEAQGEMPVNFKAAENGTYTLTVNPEGVEMNYLHLIDNMTGADIDLLAATSTGSVATYTFNASTTDYSSRFRLVFAANNEDGVSTGSTAFAFYSNGMWVINNIGEATLQVVDVNGRILSSETVNGSVSKAINAPAGVYMLRLINGNDVKTQKIVVR